MSGTYPKINQTNWELLKLRSQHSQRIWVKVEGLPNINKKLTELGDRSSRNNIRIDGIAEAPNETWEKNEISVLFNH